MTLAKAWVLVLFGAAFSIGNVFGSQAAEPPAGRTQQAEKPAEEAYKNIVELKGLPASQLTPVMFFMKASLGVNCNHCHVDFVHYDRDDKPAKQTARRMIRMVRELNRSSFAGASAVNCNTCHRGQAQPAAPLALAPIVSSADSRVKEPALETSRPLPSVDEVFDRYIAATGGTQRQEGLATLVAKGAQVSSEGWRAPLEIYESFPDKALVSFKLQGTDWSHCVNGATGWIHDNHGTHAAQARSLDSWKRDMALLRPITLRGLYSGLRVAGTERFGVHNAFVVEGVLGSQEPERLYFDVGSGLLAGITIRTDTIFGPLMEEIDVEDYRDVDSVKLPFSISQLKPDFSTGIRLDEIKHNSKIDDAKFRAPAPEK
jgi:hypothetical protein